MGLLTESVYNVLIKEKSWREHVSFGNEYKDQKTLASF